MPRTDAGLKPIRPFDISASELDILMELKPEGKVSGFFLIFLLTLMINCSKEETIITLGILDVKILNESKTGKSETLLSLAPRSLVRARLTRLVSSLTRSIIDVDTATACEIPAYIVNGAWYHLQRDEVEVDPV